MPVFKQMHCSFFAYFLWKTFHVFKSTTTKVTKKIRVALLVRIWVKVISQNTENYVNEKV